MPVFDTPEPIVANLDIDAGHIAVVASDRPDTFVEVRPANPSRPEDAKAAEATRIDFGNGALDVRSPRDWPRYLWFGVKGSVEVRVELPTGSELDAAVGVGGIDADGRLFRCAVRSGMGGIRLDQTGDLTATTGHGGVVVEDVSGDADIGSGSGSIRVGAIHGSGTIRNSNGDTRIGLTEGETRIKSANGNILVERSRASIEARTANGSVRLDDVSGGTVVAETSVGEIVVGVHPDTAAWLDVAARHGSVHQNLDATDGPGEAASTVEVRARTTVGDIVIRRSARGLEEAV